MVVATVSGVLAVKLFFDDDGSLREGVNILLLIPSRDQIRTYKGKTGDLLFKILKAE